VRLGGKKLEAASKSGFIEKNEEVKVTGKDNFRITVSKL
jgi:membrane-bound ClpP family serine protease